jgi:excisionase family DNA binding protein
MKVYTTGQVSRICQVATSTVNKWFDSGQLKGFRVPGSRHRRIPRENLVKFLDDNGISLEKLDTTTTSTVLMVTHDPKLVAALQRALPGFLKLVVAPSSFEAGVEAETLRPAAIIIDYAIGSSMAEQIGRRLRADGSPSELVLIALVAHETRLSSLERSHLDEVVYRPFDPALLAQHLETLLG